MLVMHIDAQCYTCKNNPRVVQPDGTEATEKWVCDHYTKNIPTGIPLKSVICKFFVFDNGD